MANLKNAKKPRGTALSHLATPDHKKSQDVIPKLSIDLAEAKHLNPYVEHVAKRLRALRKRMQKIEKMEEKVKSLAPHEINEEQKAVLAKKPELSITMKELTEIVDNLVQISKNPPVEEKTEEKAEEAQEQKQEETQIEQQPSEEAISEEIPIVTEAEAEAQAQSEIQNDVQVEDEIAEQEDNSTEKHFENPELFQALNFFSSLLSTYFNKSLPISPDDYQSLELFRSVVLSGDFERPDGRQVVIEHLQKLTLQSEDNVAEEYPVTYQQVHKVVSSISELNSLPPQENGDQEHQYQYESEQQTQPVEKEIQVFNTVSRPPGGFNFMTTSEILEDHQTAEEPELPAHQEIQDQSHTAFPEPQQYNAEVNYGNDQWDQYQDQINYKQDTYQQFPSADGSNEVPLVSQAGFENPLSALMAQPSSDAYPPQHAQSNDLPSQNDQDNVSFNDNQRNWQRRTNRDYRRNNNANYGGKSEYRHNYQYENNYDSNGNIGANNQYRTNSDKYRNRSNWNQNQSSPNAGDHSKTNSGHYGYNNNQNTFRNSRNHNSRSYGGNYRGPRDSYDGMISQNHNSGYQH